MAIIRPFKALRPMKEYAQLVASVPYDVVNRKEAKELTKDNEFSLLNVTRSEIHFDDSVDAYSDCVYEKAQENLHELINKGVLFIDDEPNLYLYQLIMDNRVQTGIAGTFSVQEYNDDIIKKHEKTRREKEDDRTKHILTTEAQTGPVFLTYKGINEINKLVSEVKEKNSPEYDFISADGISHTLWKIPPDITEKITQLASNIKNLYIADGHHRAASASRAAAERKSLSFPIDDEVNYFLGVLFPAEELKILPYNRVVTDLNNLSEKEFLSKISLNFNIEETKINTPSLPREICMYLNKKWYLLKSKIDETSLKTVGDKLDVSILQNYLLDPILGIDDPRTNKRIDFIGGIRGTKELEKLVDNGKAKVAFSLYPVTLDNLIEISDAGEIMPPKSTWFEPKLRDGLLIHLI